MVSGLEVARSCFQRTPCGARARDFFCLRFEAILKEVKKQYKKGRGSASNQVPVVCRMG